MNDSKRTERSIAIVVLVLVASAIAYVAGDLITLGRFFTDRL